MDNIYKNAFDNSPIIQIITNNNNVVEDVNDKFCEYFGYYREEVIGCHISCLLSKDSVELNDPDNWLEETSTNYPNVWEVQTKDKKTRFISIETTALPNGYNITVSFDLTKEGHRARKNNVNIRELRKYLLKT